MNNSILHPPSLAVASLFPEDFSIDWILELTQKKASEVIQELEEGVQQEFLIRKRPGLYAFTDPGYRHSHSESLSVKEKELLNRHIIKILLINIQDSDRKAKALSHHLLQLTNDYDGCLWLLKAGDSYLRGFKNEMALCCYRKALEDLLLQRGQEADDDQDSELHRDEASHPHGSVPAEPVGQSPDGCRAQGPGPGTPGIGPAPGDADPEGRPDQGDDLH